MSEEKEIKKLSETVEMMVSEDYIERFKAEISQLKIRIAALKSILWKWDNDRLEFEPNCPYSILNLQIEYMRKYLAILEARARIENIDI